MSIQPDSCPYMTVTKTLAPDRTGFVTVEGGSRRVYWEYFGRGEREVAVLLNGLAMLTRSWYRTVPSLHPEYDVLLYDYFGQGQSSQEDEPYFIPSLAGYLIRIGGGLLNAGVLDAFRLNTYLNGVLQESMLASSPAVEFKLISTDSELTYFDFITGTSFDEIQFVADANLLSTGVGTTLIDLFYAFVEYDADGDGVPDCRDKCCSGSDLLDNDGDGLPDACDGVPQALPDTAVVPEETTTSLDVLVNDLFGPNEAGGDSIRILIFPQHGDAVVDHNGTPGDPTDDDILYTGHNSYNGPDSLQYAICDTDLDCDTAWVQISVLPVNDPPMAVDDIAVTPANAVAHGNVLINDMDPDGDLLLANPLPVSSPEHGSVMLNADGSYTYTPDPGFTGEDQFTYQVCDNGVPVLCDTAVVYLEVVGDPAPGNLPPVANPDAQQTVTGTPLNGNLISNDDDPDGDALVIMTTPVDPPDNGSVTINPDGTYTYSPDPAFVGQDTLTYAVCDDQAPALCDTTIAIIDVLPVAGNTTFAHDDAALTLEDTPLAGNVAANDF
ncbi:MAG: Ig-like domain-containing protein, partial [Saprospiraceae bacterium]|nr:Ig-like domain-containing protein [Saprospiraceae bacterium]